MIGEEDRSVGGFFRWLWDDLKKESRQAAIDYFAPIMWLARRWEAIVLVVAPIGIIVSALVARLFWV